MEWLVIPGALIIGCAIPLMEGVFVRLLFKSRRPPRRLNTIEALAALSGAFLIGAAFLVLLAGWSQLRGPLIGLSALIGWGLGTLAPRRCWPGAR